MGAREIHGRAAALALLGLLAAVALAGCSSGDQAGAARLKGPEPKSSPFEQKGRVRSLTVSRAPLGPTTPASGWSVVYADAFGAPLGKGRGHDNTWFPNNCTRTTNCPGFNEDEMEVMNPSAVSEGAQGLRLSCTYSAKAQYASNVRSRTPKHYVCGMLRGQNDGLRGYRFFTWSPGRGQTLVFEAVAKLPPNTGEADPGWWTNGPPWGDTEVDFFEGGGASERHTSGWRTDGLYTAWFAPPMLTANKWGFSEDPSLAFHTYTFEITPQNTYSVWIDGQPQPWATNVGPAHPDRSARLTLILSYALRECHCRTGFTSGTREFDVKSVAVYEDTAHRGVGIENGGLPVGTVLAK